MRDSCVHWAIVHCAVGVCCACCAHQTGYIVWIYIYSQFSSLALRACDYKIDLSTNELLVWWISHMNQPPKKLKFIHLLVKLKQSDDIERWRSLQNRDLTIIEIKLNCMIGGTGEHKRGGNHLRKAKKTHTIGQNYYNNGISIIISIVSFVFVCCRFI